VEKPYAVVVSAAEQPTLQKHSFMKVVTAVKIMPFLLRNNKVAQPLTVHVQTTLKFKFKQPPKHKLAVLANH
jgi:hypothetical protein